MALYSTPSAQVYISGALSTPFTITNGTRQGCPLSPLMFNLLMEPLATYIRSHPQIAGIQIGSRTHTISLFADYIILMLANPKVSLPSVHEALLFFNKVSYYKINKTKSYILNLGIPDKDSQELKQTFPYIWKKDGVRYLGITLTPRTEDLISANYTPFLHSMGAR